MASTLLGSADFRRFAGGQIPVVYQSTLSVNDINYDSNREFVNGVKQTNTQKFINMWNSGTPVITISGNSSSPFSDIVRTGSYRLLARARMYVDYTFTPPPESPLTSTPPIQLNDIQNKFSATSLDGVRINAGFSSPIGMLDFLGTAPEPEPTFGRSGGIPSSVFADQASWSWSGGSSYAVAELGNTPLSSISFFFDSSVTQPGGAPNMPPIPENAIIDSIVVRVENGGITGDSGVLAPAAWWFEDVYSFNGNIDPPPPIFE